MERQIERERSKALERVFEKSTKTLRDVYKLAPPDTRVPADLVYPETHYLGDLGINAFHCRFQIESPDVLKLEGIISDGFRQVDDGSYYLRTDASGRFHRVDIGVAHEFGGAIVSLMTDDISIIRHISASILPPPPPWQVFPDIDPLALGSLQGHVEYWWSHLWNPFWNSLTPSGQEDYLMQRNAGEGWSECIRLHA